MFGYYKRNILFRFTAWRRGCVGMGPDEPVVRCLRRTDPVRRYLHVSCLAGLAGPGGYAYFAHPEFGLGEALAEGALWPEMLVRLIVAPGL